MRDGNSETTQKPRHSLSGDEAALLEKLYYAGGRIELTTDREIRAFHGLKAKGLAK